MAARSRSPNSMWSELQDWLDAFPRQTIVKGFHYHARGAVEHLSFGNDPPYTAVTARVRGGAVYTCNLSHAPGKGWEGDCDCPVSFECKHLYAAGINLLSRYKAVIPIPPDIAEAFEGDDFAASPSPSLPGKAVTPRATRSVPPSPEQSLISEFTARTGAAPTGKTLAFLRNLLAVHQSSVRGSYYFNYQALQNLLPPARRHQTFSGSYYDNPLTNRLAQPPATPLELWSHLALLFTEHNIPLPDFMGPVTDLARARAEIEAHQRELALAAWRQRFADLDRSATSSTPASAQPLQRLRLRLGPKKCLWETSAAASDGPFVPLSSTTLREFLYGTATEATAATFDDASNTLLAYFRATFQRRGRTTFSLSDEEDRALLGRMLLNPRIRACFVGSSDQPLTDDPRPLTWHLADHPEKPDLVIARLALPDGTAAPAPLIYLPGNPTLYLSLANTVFKGLPPPARPLKSQSIDFASEIPRAALALPEAGRFAARVGLTFPGDVAHRYRSEPLRARLRAEIVPRRPGTRDEVLTLALHALAPDNTARARFESTGWNTKHPDLVRPPDAAFLLHDYQNLQPATDYLAQYGGLSWDPQAPGRGRFAAEVSYPAFADNFAAWIAHFPSDTLIELSPELAALAQAPTRARFDLDLSPDEESGIDWFDVRVTLRAEDTTLTPEEIALLHAARGRFVRLAGRGWRRLALDDSPAAQEKLARLGLDPATAAETGREPLRFHALQLADEALRDTLPEKLWSQVRDRASALRASPPPATPAGLVADLRPYQHEGFHFLAFLSENNFGGVLADDMGLGKTLQTLAWLLHLSRLTQALSDSKSEISDRTGHARPFRALVICPKSVVVNWQLETARFAPALTTTAFTAALVKPGPDATSSPQLAHPGTPLLIANYTQLRLHADAFAASPWDAVILDEGQNIKNPASATAAAARALRTAHRLVLTGTPVENRLLDLWSLFAFAQPGLLGGQTAFKRLYNDKNDPTARTRLAGRVKHFLLRRTKSQVARDLPPRLEKDLEVDLDGPQRALYDAELKRTRALLLGVKTGRDFDRQRFNILQSLLRLRQICCDPRIVGVGQSATNTAVNRSAKLEALLDTLEPLVAEGHKVLIFSQFVTMLELIRDELTARDIPYLLLTGQTENRQDLVNQFQTDPAIPVFLLSLKAAGSGLNLTAASYVVLFDPWWNPAVEAQAIDRTHRIGQKNQVIAYRLIARDTVEEKIRALQKDKAALAAAVVQEESLATVLDLDSLRRILE